MPLLNTRFGADMEFLIFPLFCVGSYFTIVGRFQIEY
jgi:hypothetical protein